MADDDDDVIRIEGILSPDDPTASLNLSGGIAGLYGLTLICLGVTFFLSLYTALWGTAEVMFEAFLVYVYSLGIIVIWYIDLRIMKAKYDMKKQERIDKKLRQTNHSQDQTAHARTNTEDVLFFYAEEGASMFARMAVVVFSISIILLDGFELVQFTDLESIVWECYGADKIASTCLRIIFVLSQTYLVFKHHKVILNINKPFLKIGLYHIAAANLVIWATTVIMEAAEMFAQALTEGEEEGEEIKSQEDLAEVNTTRAPSGGDMMLHCIEDDPIGGHIGQYLFPFIIEYALLAASICYRIYSNVGKIPEDNSLPHSTPVKSKLKVGSVCHKSNTGLFRGLIVLVTMLLFTCIFLMFKEGQYIIHASHFLEAKIYFGLNISLNILGLIVTLVATLNMRKLHIVPSLEHTLDQNFLLISLCGYFFMVFFMTIAGASQTSAQEENFFSVHHVCSNLITFIQASFQTVFIMEAMRRRSTHPDHVLRKPGRSAASFLLVINLSMWLVNTFQLKELTFSEAMMSFYGQLQWIIISQMFIPLTIFYRFHSVVCLAEVWSTAYRQHEEHQLTEKITENRINTVS